MVAVPVYTPTNSLKLKKKKNSNIKVYVSTYELGILEDQMKCLKAASRKCARQGLCMCSFFARTALNRGPHPHAPSPTKLPQPRSRLQCSCLQEPSVNPRPCAWSLQVPVYLPLSQTLGGLVMTVALSGFRSTACPFQAGTCLNCSPL